MRGSGDGQPYAVWQYGCLAQVLHRWHGEGVAHGCRSWQASRGVHIDVQFARGAGDDLLSMALPLIHHGMLFVGIPWTEEAMSTTTTGGTPYGASHVSWSRKNDELSEDEKQLAQALGARVASIAQKLS